MLSVKKFFKKFFDIGVEKGVIFWYIWYDMENRESLKMYISYVASMATFEKNLGYTLLDIKPERVRVGYELDDDSITYNITNRYSEPVLAGRIWIDTGFIIIFNYSTIPASIKILYNGKPADVLPYRSYILDVNVPEVPKGILKIPADFKV